MEKLTKNQVILITVVVSAAAIIGAYFIYQTQSAPKTTKIQPAENQQIETPAAAENQQTETPAAQKTAPAAKSLSYNDALKMYVNKRIQFDANCQVSPYYSTFVNGTRVMLDNRLDKGRSVYFNDVQYYLGAYGFKIITLSSASLPKTIAIDCGTGKNNGTIVLH